MEEAIRRRGGVEHLPLVDGPIVPEFHALTLAQALEQEIERAGRVGWTKITLHMDLPDAMALAQALRRAGKRGL